LQQRSYREYALAESRGAFRTLVAALLGETAEALFLDLGPLVKFLSLECVALGRGGEELESRLERSGRVFLRPRVRELWTLGSSQRVVIGEPWRGRPFEEPRVSED